MRYIHGIRFAKFSIQNSDFKIKIGEQICSRRDAILTRKYLCQL